MVAQVEGKIETEKHLAELKLVESERSRQVLLRNFIVVALVLILVIVFQTLRRLRLKQRKDQQIFAIEKKRAEEEIRNAEGQLSSYIESLREKSNLIEQFKEEIQRLQSPVNDAGQPEQQEILEKLHYATIITEEDWTNFKNMFVKVHKDFFVRLKEKYPDLTQAETRFLSLTKLGFSVNEMANTLGISPDSVRKTRLRLRKKLNLGEHIILEDII
jgi:DNA-binding NarL/FixJ family response regulator